MMRSLILSSSNSLLSVRDDDVAALVGDDGLEARMSVSGPLDSVEVIMEDRDRIWEEDRGEAEATSIAVGEVARASGEIGRC